MVPSSFEDVTPAMRGQLKRLSRNYQRRNGGKFGEYVLIFKRRFISEMFSTLSAVVLFGWAFVWIVFVGSSLFCRLFGFRGFLKKQTLTATSTMAVLQAYVIIVCSFICRSLQNNNATICIFERTWTTTANFSNCFFEFWLSYIFCLGHFWQW